ncbi:hypothetical protein CYL21_2848 [Plasmodium falciparum NF54]|uniref:Uncharacterized protein n=3 Tax=Plasmodium falciparum TaxID=5833 RepID=Q8IHN6_PLAF7|nr:Plasmodium exported protein (hyp11), unknown function [Plasmodium falciparum 3D7]KAF4328900.1 hypothetical protein CYL21_2848 [Plasmodium falciparum NF54]PKC46710.1 hypothetical protein CK202_3022 [Plasmodium falciparum NF54]CZT99145.1 Plasmodium exported protein (hyp11), unknown function [Plasmodium falciparum 3D7]|eukprot:XP_001348160.2 Plasmodium exported protein (hyp11), unknown function [Plasmodium falciparum 3D7]
MKVLNISFLNEKFRSINNILKNNCFFKEQYVYIKLYINKKTFNLSLLLRIILLIIMILKFSLLYNKKNVVMYFIEEKQLYYPFNETCSRYRRIVAEEQHEIELDEESIIVLDDDINIIQEEYENMNSYDYLNLQLYNDTTMMDSHEVNMQQDGDINIQQDGDINMQQDGDINIQDDDINIQQDGDINIQQDGDINIQYDDINIQQDGDINTEQDDDIILLQEDDIDLLTDEDINFLEQQHNDLLNEESANTNVQNNYSFVYDNDYNKLHELAEEYKDTLNDVISRMAYDYNDLTEDMNKEWSFNMWNIRWCKYLENMMEEVNYYLNGNFSIDDKKQYLELLLFWCKRDYKHFIDVVKKEWDKKDEPEHYLER